MVLLVLDEVVWADNEINDEMLQIVELEDDDDFEALLVVVLDEFE